MQIVEAFLRKLPASALSLDIIALALEPSMLGAERLDLNEKRRGHLVVIGSGNPPHEIRSLALYLRNPLVQCSDVQSGRVSIVQPRHYLGDHLGIRKYFFNST